MVGNGGDEGEGKRVIDATVGGLVWVRRGNGSWWPGQIVGFEELPEDGLGCARSATRIKLLDRDDSSVELHDLEKTKGVKAFRCGDYDSCIEKAKASAAAILRRSLKRPKRERAIVYALEIEKNNLLNNHPSLQSQSCNNSEGHPKHAEGSATASRPSCAPQETSSERTSSFCEDNSYSTQELSHSGISYEENNGSICKRKSIKGKRRKTPNDSDEDGSEGVKRMKGLNDLGVGAVNKIEMLSIVNSVSQTNILLSNFHDANCLALGSVPNGGSVPTLKRKRSQVVQIHEILKKKYRRRPLTKVLENTSMVPVQIICDEFATPFERSDALSPSYECGNSNKLKDSELVKEQFSADDPLHSLFDVPFLDQDLQSSGYSPIQKTSSPSKPLTDSFRGNSSQNVQVQASSSDHEVLNKSFPVYSSVNQKAEEGASKWQSKGKRNARLVTKADIDYDNSDTYTMDLKDQARFSPISNGLVNGFTKPVSMASSPRSFSYQPRFLVHSSVEISDVPSIYEVEISVEATRPQVQQVPYISLMSKLSGKPIIGHPITVEVLQDGICDLQITDCQASGSYDSDENVTGFDVTIKPMAPRRPKHIILQPHLSHKKSSRSKKKKQKKRHRRGSSSKKTRKLSSLTGPDKLYPEKKKSIVQNCNGLTMAYVPLKVVFSRINEALNSSNGSAH